MIPLRPDVPNAEKEIDENHERIENAFQKYIHRSDSKDAENRDEFEVIVGHGNVIRYFFCRYVRVRRDYTRFHLAPRTALSLLNSALQLPPEAWLRMGTFNCSITYIMIRPNGYCSVRMLGGTLLQLNVRTPDSLPR